MIKIKKVSKKYFYLTLIGLSIVALIIFLYINKLQERSDLNPKPGETDYINLNPPTEEEKKQAEDNKQKLIQRQNLEKDNQNQQSNQKKNVKPVITFASQFDQTVEVGSYVPGIFEDNGTCTATFTLNNRTVTKSVQAIKNVNSVACPNLKANVNEFPQKGLWQVVVSYVSETASGASDPNTVEVK